MNRVYRLVFNRARRVLQVASELTQAQGGPGMTVHAAPPRRHPLTLACLVALGAVVATSSLWAVSPVAAQTIDHATGGSGGSINDGAGGDAGQSGVAGMDGTVGAGGDGGAAGAMGSPGTPGGDGEDGGAGHDDSGAGGGGGGGHGGTLTASPSADMTGGNGGSGGTFDHLYGGGGGGGGDGAWITQDVTLSIDSNITLQGGRGGGFGDASSSAGGGGGAGLYVTGSNIDADLTVNGTILGGDGGDGGGSGAGGGGGAGVVVADGAELHLDLNGDIAGGAGGAGWASGTGGDGIVAGADSQANVTLETDSSIVGGAGVETGVAGAGLRLSGGGTVTNNGGTIAGGAEIDGWGSGGTNSTATGGDGSGGAAGGVAAAGSSARAGVGIVGQNLMIANAGTIEGGLNLDGTRANAITFTGGTNALWLRDGSVIHGIVDATAGSQDRLMLGDISSGSVAHSTFDVGQLGPAKQFRGFEQFWAVGNSLVTLTGTTTEVTPWTIDSDAILSVATDASLGDASGDLLLRYGGVLQVTGVANETTARNIGIYQQGFIDIANADNNFTVIGAISDYDPPGSTGPQGSMLLKVGAGTLTLAGNNTYTGGTWVGGGTLDITAGSSAGPLASAGAPSSGVIHLAGGTTLHNAGTVGSVEYDGSLGQPADALQAVTVSNSGSIVGDGNSTGRIIALLNGTITNSGNISSTTPVVMGSGAVQLKGEGRIDNTGTISSTPYSRTVLLGSMLSTSLSSTGGIDLANRAGGVIEGGIGVAARQMVALTSGGGGTTYANRPISITNDGGTIRGSLVGVELLTGGTIINRAGSTIEYTGTATDPCADFFSMGLPANGRCAIHAPDAAALGTPPGVTIAPTVLTNAGNIVGDVQLGDGLANDVTLVAGGSIDGDLDIGTSSDALLTLKGGAGTTQNWSQAVTGSTTFAGSLTKSGAGTWVLDNAALADVTGTTQLQAGSLIVGGSSSDGGVLGGNVAVAAAATLGGHGTIDGDVTVADGGHIAPGNSVGTLTVGSLKLNSGSILDFELGSPGSSADPASGVSDRIDVAGDLALDGTLNLAQSTDSTDGSAGLGYYRLLTYGGTLTDNGLEVGTTPTIAGAGGFQIQAGSGNVDLFIASLGDDTLQHWQGGDGTWNATDTQWLNKNSTVPVTWAGNHAVFKNEPGGFNGGTVTVNGTQTFKGLQFVDSGYQLQGPGTLQIDGSDRADGNAEIRVLANETATIATTIAGSGGITKTQGGTLVFSGSNTYSGGTNINGGTLSVSSDANLGAGTGVLTLNGGTLQNTAAFTTTRDIVLNGAGAFQADADLTVSGVISGAGALTKTGSGVLELGHANSYAGGTTVAKGKLRATITGALGTGPVKIEQSGLLDFVNDASADNLAITNVGGLLKFRDDSSAGSAIINSTGNGSINFYGTASAKNATLNVGGASVAFNGSSSAADAHIIIASGGGNLDFYNAASAGRAVINNGSGSVRFHGNNTADHATIINNTTVGMVDISGLTSNGVGIGSLSGGGDVLLGSKTLTLGGLGKNDTIGGIISGSGNLVKTGHGTLTLDGNNTYTGGTTIASGTLQLGDGGTTGSIIGDVVDNGTLVFNRSDAITFDGAVSGSGVLVQAGTGTLILTGANTWSGGTVIDAGTLKGDSSSLQGAITNNAALVFAQSANGTFDGSLSGTGSVTKTGAGELIFNNDSSAFSGRTDIANGALIVGDDGHADAALGGMVNVGKQGLLGGFGTVGGIDLSGTLATGHSIGTLHVAGDATFQPGSIWQIEVMPNGHSDALDVAGNVTIKGGSAVVLGDKGNWKPRTDYTILTADGGLTGQFDKVEVNLAFLEPTLAYAANSVTLSLQRNGIDFNEVAHTPNQKGVAGSVQDLGPEDPVHDAVVTMTPDQARHAFDQLSGEWYASNLTTRLHDSRYVREAMNQRLTHADDARPDAGSAAIDGTAGTVWFQAWGHWGERDGNGNAARVKPNGSGLLVGVDAAIGEDARIGGALGASQSSTGVVERVSDGHDKATWLGIYGSMATGPVHWRAGLAYAREKVDSNRHITIPGLVGRVGADIDGHTAQAWLEAALPQQTAHGRFAPYLNLAHVRVQSDRWREAGSAAALEGQGGDAKASLATLGIRGAWQVGSTDWPVRLHGSLGWRQAFGADTPQARMSIHGSTPFTAYGLPLAKHAVAVQAGMDFAIGTRTRIDIGYSGQFAGDMRDQGGRITLKIAF
ncbi:MAG TPA: autotransporter domain-containing protein [Oleiagrimonas sp.]|nr:autotransporter domain-containing protein [Oleiagrimonas sp.]